MAGPVETKGGGMFSATTQRGFQAQLKKVYTFYTGGFLFFVVALAILEQMETRLRRNSAFSVAVAAAHKLRKSSVVAVK